MEFAIKVFWYWMVVGVITTACFVFMETILIHEKGIIGSITAWANKDKTAEEIENRTSPLKLTLGFLLECVVWPILMFLMYKAYPHGLTVLEWMECEEKVRREKKAEKMVADATARLKAEHGIKVEVLSFETEEEMEAYGREKVRRLREKAETTKEDKDGHPRS